MHHADDPAFALPTIESSATASLTDAPFHPRTQRPSTFEPQTAAHALAQWYTTRPTCRTSLSTASRKTTLIRTDAPPFHAAAALRPERFWSVEKTNAGESKLRSLSQALAALRELVRAGA